MQHWWWQVGSRPLIVRNSCEVRSAFNRQCQFLLDLLIENDCPKNPFWNDTSKIISSAMPMLAPQVTAGGKTD
jgi:hypothetical protein